MFVSDLKREFYDVILGRVWISFLFSIKRLGLFIFVFCSIIPACSNIRQLRCGCHLLVSHITISASLWHGELLHRPYSEQKWTSIFIQGQCWTGHQNILLIRELHLNKITTQQASHVIFINCGGTIDLVDLLEPSEEKVFFVADSHRPYDVCNIYNDGQVHPNC